ncbi:MAG: hypothetical protein HZC29_00380 [Thaumarchaeota archaeon]|nr:hypothetical protein [Nitrososphaerota archaeon]
MGYLRNQLATVVTACFAVFLTVMYFYMPAALNQLLLVATTVTWFLVFICWIAQKSHEHIEKKSSTRLVSNVSVEDLNKFRESFTAELNDLKDEVKLKDNEIERMRQEIANLETLVQIEALKAELANLKAVAAKRK